MPQKGSRNASRRNTRKTTPQPEFAESTYITPAEARQLSRATQRAHPAECICTICNCGAHKCPPDRVAGRYHNLRSSYMDDFKGGFQEPARPHRPQYIHKPRPFVGTTTSADAFCYKGKPVRREMSRLKDNGLLETGAVFEGTTTNQHDFRQWGSAVRQPMKQQSALQQQDDDRNFVSEANSQYTMKPYAVRKSRRPVNNSMDNGMPFEGITTSATDFQQWNSRPAQSCQKHTQYRPRAEDRDFMTDSRSTYTHKKREYCPAVVVAVTSKPENGHVMVEKCGDRYCHKMHVHEWDQTQVGEQQPLF